MHSSSNARFKQLMQEVGATASDLSRIFSLKIQGVYKYLNGQSIPRVELLEKLIKEFPQLSMEYLVRGEEPMLREREDERLAALEKDLATLRELTGMQKKYIGVLEKMVKDE